MNKKIISQDVENRIVIVKENGDIEVTEFLKTVYEQGAREFRSDYENLVKWQKDIEGTLKPEFVEKQEKHLEKINEEINKIKEFVEESDTKATEYNKAEMKKGKLEKIRYELNKPKKEQNVDYLSALYDNIKVNDKDLWDSLEKEEQNQLKKIKLSHIQFLKR